MPGEVADNTAKTSNAPQAESKRKGEFVIAPLPSRSPLLGWSLGVPALYIYKPKNAQKEDRPWVSGVAGFYTETDSYGLGAFQKMSVGGDKWRIIGSVFGAQLKYDYFGIGGNQDFVLPIDQKVSVGLAEALRNILIPDLFFGLRYTYSRSDLKTVIGPELIPGQREPLEIAGDYTLSSVAPRVVYDTRDNEFYPRTGWLIEGQVALGLEALGSDTDYEKLELAINDYRSFSDKAVLASRIAINYVDGDAPFFLFPAFGQGADLRGYQTGTFRDRYLFAAQTELRYRITPRNGIVAFVGVGTVDSSFGGWGKTLPSGGAGYRFVLAPKNDLSFRVDFAWGRDDRQFYVGIGEAF